MAISLSLSSSEIFTPSTLAAWSAITSTATLHRLLVVAVSPIARERGIEHLAEPVDDHRLLHLTENAAIDLGVIVAAARRLYQRAACHQHDAPAELFDLRALFLVGADDVVEGHVVTRIEMIGAGAAADQRAGKILALRRGSCGSIRARSSSRRPCRAGPCPWPRRRRARATTGAGGMRWCAPSRWRSRARDRHRPADRRRHARRRRRCG